VQPPSFVGKLLGQSAKPLNPAAQAILKRHQRPGEHHISDEEIFLRTVGRMANEAVDCLKEGILNSATDGDIGAVFGLGFPPFLGGPFRWIDHIGAPVLVRQLQGFASTYGPQFAPSELLVDMAKKGTKFHNKD
jgi:3-hydroxyacyl-CoA dehydrogenase